MPHSPSRRQLLHGAGAVAALGAVGAGGAAVLRELQSEVDPHTVIPLWSQTVAYDKHGQRVLVGGRAAALPLAARTRLAADHPARSAMRDRAEEFWEGTAQWRAGLSPTTGAAAEPDGPTESTEQTEQTEQTEPTETTETTETTELAGLAELSELAESALLDLWVLSDDVPAPVAGWSPSWRYIWPRDAAFCAVALARVGQLDRALTVLEHLQSLQGIDGWFEARYDPVTGRAPDRRPRQFDGTGLLLWAVAEVIEVAASVRPTERDTLLDRLSPLVTSSQAALVTATRGGASLPPASPDYWERHEQSVTLGIMATTLVGLRSAAGLTGEQSAQEASETFTHLLEGTFGASGHQRYRQGGGADSACAFLDATGCHGVLPSGRLLSLRTELARPGGGISPGASWREDGVSWTPSTSLLGLALARSGKHAAAQEILRWLAAHRTPAGSLPEKVLFDGRAAEVAPLAWTAANVLLTLDELSRG